MGKHQRRVWQKIDARQKAWDDTQKRLAGRKGMPSAYRKPGSRKLRKG